MINFIFETRENARKQLDPNWISTYNCVSWSTWMDEEESLMIDNRLDMEFH